MLFRQPFSGSFPITLDFGEAWPPLYTHESPHQGIDYGTPIGTPILASADGTVTVVKDLPNGYGKYIMLQHEGGYQTIYAHLSTFAVRIGQEVSKGDIIGYSGSSGNSTGPHLHFEMRNQGVRIDPKPIMQSVVDTHPINPTPTVQNPEFEPVRAGKCIVVCDALNARCHCDMNTIRNVLKKDAEISVSDKVTFWNGLPYREYYDTQVRCFLMVAEHDFEIQLIKNIG